jgi:arylsulfatase
MLKKIKCALVAMLLLAPLLSSASQNKPNILVIWGDDIGTRNISHNNRGMLDSSI